MLVTQVVLHGILNYPSKYYFLTALVCYFRWALTAGCTVFCCTECPTRYRTRHFFNNFTTNEDIATEFEAELPHCVRNVTTTNILLFQFRCNILIGVRIIKEMPCLVASGTPCITTLHCGPWCTVWLVL
jgi:hypothetical protein